MNKPLVSVIIPSYRHAKYIGQAIESALSQTYTNIEVLISDNGSHDGSREIIESYKNKDSRIKTNFFDFNQGPYKNGETLMQMSGGKYYAFLFSDDYWASDKKLEKQVEILENDDNIGAVFTHANAIADTDDVTDPEVADTNTQRLSNVFNSVPNYTRAEFIRRFFFYGNCLCMPSVVVHKKLYDEIHRNGNFSFLYNLGDFYIWTQLIKQKQIYVIQEKLTCHRQHGRNMSTPDDIGLLGHINETQLILGTYFDDMPRELFIEAFYDDFLHKNNLDDEALLCEQFFLLANNPIYKIQCANAALFKLFEHRKNKKFISALTDRYGFTVDDARSLVLSYKHDIPPDRINLINRYQRVVDYFIHPAFKTAIYIVDAQLSTGLVTYIADHIDGGLSRIACLIADNAIEDKEAAGGLKIVSLTGALNNYGVNAIIAARYSFNKQLYEDVRVKEKKPDVKIIELFSVFEECLALF